MDTEATGTDTEPWVEAVRAGNQIRALAVSIRDCPIV